MRKQLSKLGFLIFFLLLTNYPVIADYEGYDDHWIITPSYSDFKDDGDYEYYYSKINLYNATDYIIEATFDWETTDAAVGSIGIGKTVDASSSSNKIVMVDWIGGGDGHYTFDAQEISGSWYTCTETVQIKKVAGEKHYFYREGELIKQTRDAFSDIYVYKSHFPGYSIPAKRDFSLIEIWANNSDYEPPVPTAGFHATPTSGDTPLNVKFWDDSTGGDHWIWYFGDGYYTEYTDTAYGPYPQGGPTHTYYEAGSYTVQQCVQNDAGDVWENKTHYIQVGEQPEQDLLAHFYAEPTSGGKPLYVKFWDQSEGDPTHWVWYFGDGTYTEYTDSPYPPYTAGGPTHTYQNPGLYTVNLMVENTTASDWENKTDYITVEAGGPPYADWFASPSEGPAPLDVHFYDTSSGDPTDWLWEYDDGYYSEHQANPWHTFEEPGSYLVTMTCSNEYGEDSKAGYITVTNATEGTLTITAIDATTRALIHSAHVEIEGFGETMYDDDFDGTVSYDLPLGSLYHITVSSSGYYDQDFQFVLTEDMSMTVALIRTGTAPEGKSSIDFVVRSNVTAQPLRGAYVYLGDDGSITDEGGYCHFEVSNTSGTLEWVVSKTGWYTEQGWVDTDNSTTTYVTLIPLPTPTTTTPTTTPTTLPGNLTATPTPDTRTPEEKVNDAASIWINGAEFISGLLFLAVIFCIVDLFGGRRRGRR